MRQGTTAEIKSERDAYKHAQLIWVGLDGVFSRGIASWCTETRGIYTTQHRTNWLSRPSVEPRARRSEAQGS